MAQKTMEIVQIFFNGGPSFVCRKFETAIAKIQRVVGDYKDMEMFERLHAPITIVDENREEKRICNHCQKEITTSLEKWNGSCFKCTEEKRKERERTRYGKGWL